MNFRVLALRNLISVIGGGVIGIIAAAMGFGWWALIIQQGVTAALNAFLLWIASDWRPSLSFGKADARDCFAYSRWMILWALMAFFERQLDILVVSSMIGTAAAGYYSTAQRLTMILYDLATSVVGQLFLPIFSRLQDNREELASVFCRILPATAMLLLPACVGLACVAPEAVGVVLGEKWLPAAPVVSLLSLYVAISGICFLNFQLMTALNKPNWIVAWTIPLIVTNIAFMIPAAKYGISAIAAVLLIRTALLMPLSIISVKRLIPISAKDLGISLIPSVTACLAMVAAIMGTKEAVSGHLTDFWTLALLLPLGCAVYFGTMRLLFSMHLRNNIDYLRQLNQRL
jgi:PST family polysaccharide transporter